MKEESQLVSEEAQAEESTRSDISVLEKELASAIAAYDKVRGDSLGLEKQMKEVSNRL